MRPQGPIQQRLKPWQILVVLLYGEMDFIERSDVESISLRLGPLARFLCIPNYRLRDHLKWLDEYGYIRGLNMTYGKAELQLCTPLPYQKVWT